MSSTIDTYHDNDLEGLVAVWNAETADEPHIAPLTPDRFARMVAPKSYFDPEGLFVAREDRRVLGWVHACFAAGTEPWNTALGPIPRIVMLLFPRTRLDLGYALVSEAKRWLSRDKTSPQLGMEPSQGYPFYRGLWLGGEPMCPTTLPHVHAALEIAGFKAACEELVMVASLERPPRLSTTPAEWRCVERATVSKDETMAESWEGFEPREFHAMLGNEEVGALRWVMLPEVADRLGAPCVNIWGLGVNEAHRRKGIATRLMEQVLVRGHALGARHASVGTQLWNRPAQWTYARFGYQPYRLAVGRKLAHE